MKVKILGPNGPNAHGTRIFLEDHELQEVCDIAVSFPVDGLAKVDVTCNLDKNFQWEGPAEVHVHLHLPEGTRLVDTTHLGMEGQQFLVVKVTPEEIPAVLCAHANECPSVCPCPPHCYCRRQGSAPACKESSRG